MSAKSDPANNLPSYEFVSRVNAPIIFAPEGQRLSTDEINFFKNSKPLGFILFTRNCESRTQIVDLIDSLRSAVGYDAPILIDQEGGRVQRLKPPFWRQYPPMKSFGDQALSKGVDEALEDLRYTTLQLGEELAACGIDVNCAPVLDVLFKTTHDAIGDRAFASDPDLVARLGMSVCRQLIASGVRPVIKHLPGHGRALVDSHHDLPMIEASLEELQQSDFSPFQQVARSDIGAQCWGMVAHVMLHNVDAELPTSLSPYVIKKIIREHIGFDGVLLSDDLDMKALSSFGTTPDVAKMCIEAGCDLALHCSGALEEMHAIMNNLPEMRDDTITRLKNAGQNARKMAV